MSAAELPPIGTRVAVPVSRIDGAPAGYVRLTVEGYALSNVPGVRYAPEALQWAHDTDPDKDGPLAAVWAMLRTDAGQYAGQRRASSLAPLVAHCAELDELERSVMVALGNMRTAEGAQ